MFDTLAWSEKKKKIGSEWAVQPSHLLLGSVAEVEAENCKFGVITEMSRRRKHLIQSH